MIKREYYSLDRAAGMIGCTVDDLLYLGATGEIPIIALTSGLLGILFNKEGYLISSERKNEPILTNYCFVPKECLIEHESGKARGKNKLSIPTLNSPDNSGNYWVFDGEKYGIPVNGSSLFLLANDMDCLISDKVNHEILSSEKSADFASTHHNPQFSVPLTNGDTTYTKLDLTELPQNNVVFTIDTNHSLCSNEFTIALKAWMAVLAQSPTRPKVGSRKTLILNWLEANYSKELPTEAKNRIAVLLNPDKNGGSPPSS